MWYIVRPDETVWNFFLQILQLHWGHFVYCTFYLLCDFSYMTFWKTKTVERVRRLIAVRYMGVETGGKEAAQRATL